MSDRMCDKICDTCRFSGPWSAISGPGFAGLPARAEIAAHRQKIGYSGAYYANGGAAMPGPTIRKFLSVASGLAAFTAAGLGLAGASRQVPDNIDTFILVLHEISVWNSWAAMAAGVAALCSLLVSLSRRAP